LMLALGKSVLIFDQVDTTKEIYKGIDALTASDLRDIANQVFDEKVLSYLIYNQREDQEEMYI
jgi:predicted Zn-dependent peptidase